MTTSSDSITKRGEIKRRRLRASGLFAPRTVVELTFLIQRTNIARMPEFRIGTSAFTAAGWEQAFYPAGMKAADYLRYYATKFNTVEVDSTFYRTPSVATVNGWERKTPRGSFLPPRFRRSSLTKMSCRTATTTCSSL